MIHHTVLLRWKPTTTTETQRQLAGKLLALQGVIPEVRTIATGPNRDLESAQEWPFVLEVQVDDLEALRRYSDHPAHLAVVKELREAREVRLAIDLQVG
jgi:stress responsive alpha/beta barrel protein